MELQSTDRGLFSDQYGGFWAFATAGLCTVVVGAAHLLLLVASLGAGRDPSTWRWPVALVTGAVALVAGGVTALLWRLLPQGVRVRCTAVPAAFAVGLLAGLTVLFLFGVSWLSARGDELAWQPVVGIAVSVVAVASFGGFFLASRRARVGIAASFLLTFMVLFSFVLTLDALARSSDASDVVRGLLTDFRNNVGLIIASYFGSDAAITVVKLWQTSGKDPVAVAQLTRGDRDIATPMPTIKQP